MAGLRKELWSIPVYYFVSRIDRYGQGYRAEISYHWAAPGKIPSIRTRRGINARLIDQLMWPYRWGTWLDSNG